MPITTRQKSVYCQLLSKFKKSPTWAIFLSEVAPQLKSAELIAEDNARQNCISSVSSCFQKACKDNIDPNDPDGSYDMCLTRPETMLNFCKIPLNACGISTDTKKKSYEKSSIWSYIKAVMASMRVDSCTNEFKECLQSPDRCGDDYSQCIGLDFESIKGMCPLDKLVGCQQNGKGADFSDTDMDLTGLLQGIFLSVDNAMLDQCQNIVTQKMIEICGDTATCDAFDSDEYLGTEGLRLSKDGNDFVVSGMVSFGNVKVKQLTEANKSSDNYKFGGYEINIGDYLNNVEGTEEFFNISNDEAKAIAKSSLEAVQSTINQTMALLTQDTKIQMCVTGRDMSQVRGGTRTQKIDAARFPHILDSSMLTIINSGLDKARANHAKKFNELVASAMEEQNDQVKQALCAAMASSDEPVCTEYDKDGACIGYTASATYLDNLFSTTTLNDPYATQYVIPGANLTNLVKLSSNASKEYIMTDGKNNMLGSIQMSTVYSAKDNMCSLTTNTLMCKNAKEIITTDKTSKTKNRYSYTQEYQGTVCTEFDEPIVTTQDIKM